MNVRTFRNGKLEAPRHPEQRCDEDATHATTPARRSSPRSSQSGGSPDGLSPAKTVAPDHAKNVFTTQSLETLVKSKAFVVISLPHCAQCEELGAFLAARGVPPASVFTKWDKCDPQYPSLKAALAVHAGDGFSFPQVFAHADYQGGYEEVMAKVGAGVYDALFEEHFGVVPTTVRRWVEQRPMVVFSLPNCPQCDVLRAHLDKRGLPTSDIFVKWDKAAPEYPALKSQIIELIGRSQFSFPQTFVRAEHQGDFDEVIAKSDAGQLDDFFFDTFGVQAPVRFVASAPEVVSFDDDF